jgi:hypothetical protein
MLRIASQSCREREYLLDQAREQRDREALRLVDAGHTWREVAAIAGFTNPYIKTLKAKRLADMGMEP